jgi:DNA segregation ATPase FtsK/SpoIIIE, S-DNA-T family
MSALTFTVGRDQATGAAVSADLAQLPHLLVAGTTGSGKTTFVHSILTELIGKHGPDELRLLLIDPKRVELRGYRRLPHLISSPVVGFDDALEALDWLEGEMERRFARLERANARDIAAFNATARKPLPRIVVVIDELANLILTERKAIERPLVQVAAMGRAAGIHLILATQHPSADVLTGLLRANVGARAAFTTVTSLDSRIILGAKGAEVLGGKGAMLFRAGQTPVRLQGRYVGDAEIAAAVSRWPSAPSPEPWAVEPEPVDPPRRSLPSLRPLLAAARAIALPALALVVAVSLGTGLSVALVVAGVAWWLAR